MFSIRILTHQPLRLMLTIGGSALCIVLILFLVSIYRGVADGSVEYVRKSNADIWVLQRNATNILRGSSILSTAHGYVLREIPGVQVASPVLFILTTVRTQNQAATLFLAGYDLQTGLGGPPEIRVGRTVADDDEIVLDRSFAAKFGYNVGDIIRLQDDSLRVVGLSGGTNAFVIQYAFASIHRVQSQIGFPTLVTCYQVQIAQGYDVGGVMDAIRSDLPAVEVYDRQVFLNNNVHEMESGFLPLLYTLAFIGGIVLTVILSLLLSINLLERKKDFAVLKTLGAPRGFLPRTIIAQAAAISTSGCLVGIGLFFPLSALIEKLSPEVSTKSSVEQVLVVVGGAIGLGLISALFTVRRLRSIYALEAFT